MRNTDLKQFGKIYTFLSGKHNVEPREFTYFVQVNITLTLMEDLRGAKGPDIVLASSLVNWAAFKYLCSKTWKITIGPTKKKILDPSLIDTVEFTLVLKIGKVYHTIENLPQPLNHDMLWSGRM